MDDYGHGKEHGELERALADLHAKFSEHVSTGSHEHEHSLTPAEVEEVVEAAAEVLKAVAEDAPEEAREEVEKAAAAAEEACEAVEEATETPDVDEEPPARTHPLYRAL